MTNLLATTLPVEGLNLQETSHQIYLCASGGGAGLQSLLWEVPGVSKVLVGAEFPYATKAMDRFLGFVPEKYCSPETAVDLAIESLRRAKDLTCETTRDYFTTPCLGLGLTATLATSREHKGEHRVHVAVLGGVLPEVARTLVLPKGVWTREEEGRIASQFGYQCLLYALGQTQNLAGVYPESNTLIQDQWFKRPLWDNYGGDQPGFERMEDRNYNNGRHFYPGSFNPPHEGHHLMGGTDTWMIDAGHPDKGTLTVPEMLTRALASGQSVLFTRGLGWFVDKFKAFPECSWTMGTDTLERVLNSLKGPKADEVLRIILETRSKILVHNRPGSPTLDELGVKYNLPGYPSFIGVPHKKNDQRVLSLSSTKLREEWSR